MFTIYIHILEVLAQNPNGASVKMISDMSGGLIPSERQALSYLRDLKTQGFVDLHSDPAFWVITDKAVEYCETVVRKYDASRVVNKPEETQEEEYDTCLECGRKFLARCSVDSFYCDACYSEGAHLPKPENMPSETPQEAITGVLTEDTTFTMPLMGNNTIAEVVEGIEKVSGVKVVKANLDNGIVTLTVRTEIAPGELYEFEECYECGGSANYHEEWCPYNEA